MSYSNFAEFHVKQIFSTAIGSSSTARICSQIEKLKQQGGLPWDLVGGEFKKKDFRGFPKPSK